MKRYPKAILRQSGDTFEGRAVGQAAMLLDIPTSRATIDELHLHKDALLAGTMPVGSVEFVRQALAVAGIPEPAPLSYPKPLMDFLGRQVSQVTLGDLTGTHFIKPVRTKLFTGFVYRAGAELESYSEHDQEQLSALSRLPAETPLWASEPVKFDSEWRYYVVDGQLLGYSRYDPNGVDYPRLPDSQACLDAVKAMSRDPSSPAAYSLDVGVLESGETVLVEVNDGWALGLYGQSVESRDYVWLLWARWEQLHANALAPIHSIDARPSRPRAC